MTEAARPQTYYPSMVANVVLRFDEDMLAGSKLGASQSVDSLAQASTAPSLSVTAKGDRPAAVQGAKDDLTVVLNLTPKAANVELPSPRLPGKFNLTFERKDFPVDPRVVRSCSVEMHLGCVPATDFAAGMGQVIQIDAMGRPVERRRSQLNVVGDDGRTRTDTLLMCGYVDEITTEDTEKGSTVQMEGRDYRGLLLDAEVRPELVKKVEALQLNKPIQEVVKQILQLHPMQFGIEVKAETGDWDGGKVPSPAVTGNLTRVNRGAKGDGAKVRGAGDVSKLSVWDLITQYCYLVGAIPFFVGPTLWVRPARSIYDKAKAETGSVVSSPTPYKSGEQRNVTTGEYPSVRQYAKTIRTAVFGRNIASLKFGRKFAGTATPVIELVCIDTDSSTRGIGKLLTCQVPSKEELRARRGRVSPSGEEAEEKPVTFPVHGVKNLEELRRIATDLREEIARGEMGGSISTRDLASLGGDNADPDLVRIRPGDPIEILVDTRSLGSRPPIISELTDRERFTEAEAIEAVAARLGDRKAARALVKATRGSLNRIQTLFRVGNVKFSWDANSGVAIDLDFQNYLESRNAIVPSTGPKKGTVKAKVGA